MSLLRTLCVCFLAAGLSACAAHPELVETADPGAVQTLPLDPAVDHGRLANGFSYYLRRNGHPEKRISLRLVVRAGSLMERDDERGLAHLVEHMAFNGTRHFPKNSLIARLEAMGVEFGSHINAFTSYTETVYQLTVPSDNPENLATALTILRDWADGISFPEDEVAKERGVVMEEWRMRKGVDARIQDQVMNLVYAGTRYLERKPIGDTAIVQAATAQSLRAFYRRWYVPQRMALVAVGDLDPKRLQQTIAEAFGAIAARPAPPVPDETVHGQPGFRYATVLDPENTTTTAELAVVHPERPLRSHDDYRDALAEQLALSVLNERLEDRAAAPGSPLLAAGVSSNALDRHNRQYVLGARTTRKQLIAAFTALEGSLHQALSQGVSADELARQKADYLAGLEADVRDRDRTRSDDYVDDYVEHFLSGEPYFDIRQALTESRAALAEITPATLDRSLKRLFGTPDRLALVVGPQKPGLSYPDAVQVSQALAAADRTAPAPVSLVPARHSLMQTLPTPGRLVSEREDKDLGVTELHYSNGVTVLLKPTAFKQGEILMRAFSPGGLSKLGDDEYRDAVLGMDAIANSGFGPWSLSQLKKLTAGQLLSLSPYINNDEEGLNGATQPQDLETLLQLTYYAFTAPRLDPGSFEHSRTAALDYIAHRDANSGERFSAAVRQAYMNNHPRSRPWTVADVHALHAETALRAYKARFANAGDFNFVFVGRFDVAAIKPLLARYLGSLPDHGQREQPDARGLRPFVGQHALTLAEASEPRTWVLLQMTGPARWSSDELYLYSALQRILNERLRSEIRENLSGVYDISYDGSITPYPTPHYDAQIGFFCAPERAEELVAAVRRILTQLREQGVRPEELNTVLAAQREDYQSRQHSNHAWLEGLSYYRAAGWPLKQMFLRNFPNFARELTPKALNEVAKRYLDLQNLLLAELTPPAQATTGKPVASQVPGR